MTDKTRLNFLIDEGLNKKLNVYVSSTHIPKSQVIRMALEYYLEVTPSFDNVPKLKKLIEEYLNDHPNIHIDQHPKDTEAHNEILRVTNEVEKLLSNTQNESDKKS